MKEHDFDEFTTIVCTRRQDHTFLTAIRLHDNICALFPCGVEFHNFDRFYIFEQYLLTYHMGISTC